MAKIGKWVRINITERDKDKYSRDRSKENDDGRDNERRKGHMDKFG